MKCVAVWIIKVLRCCYFYITDWDKHSKNFLLFVRSCLTPPPGDAVLSGFRDPATLEHLRTGSDELFGGTLSVDLAHFGTAGGHHSLKKRHTAPAQSKLDSGDSQAFAGVAAHLTIGVRLRKRRGTTALAAASPQPDSCSVAGGFGLSFECKSGPAEDGHIMGCVRQRLESAHFAPAFATDLAGCANLKRI
jgi:hypothetical protein